MLKIAAILLSVSCGLYISLPFVGKPYNILFVILMLFSILYILKRSVLPNSGLVFVVLSIWLFYFIKLWFMADFLSGVFIFNVLNFLMALIIFSKVDIKSSFLAFRFGVIITFISFFIEAYFRFNNPYFGGATQDIGFSGADLKDNFYIYKINSLMYLNSNGVGMHAVFLFSFVLYLKSILRVNRGEPLYFHKYELNYYAILIFLFSILSLSRGAVMICIILYLVYIFNFLKVKLKIYTALLMVPIFILLLFNLFSQYSVDGSFLTKLEIANNLFLYLNQVEFFELIFGNVYGDPYKIYNGFKGFVGHTHYFELVFFGGLLGTILFILFFFLISLKNKFIFLYFTFAFIILGFFNVRIFAHYLFLYIGWTVVLHNKFNDYKKGSLSGTQ